MSPRSRVRAAAIVGGIAATLEITGVVLFVIAPHRPVPDGVGFGFDLPHILSALLTVTPFGAVGVLIVARRPGNTVGWLALLIGFGGALGFFSGAYEAYALFANPGRLPGGVWMAWIGNFVWGPVMGTAAAVLPLVFPGGHLLSRRWRPALWLAIVGTACLTVGLVLQPVFSPSPVHNPIQLPALSSIILGLGAIGMPLIGLSAVVGIASLVVRYRRSDADGRHQIRWLAAAFAVLVLAISTNFFVQGTIADVALGLGLSALPAGIGIAVLRYHLYDIDVVISRTLVYAALAGLITAVYVGIVVGVGSVLGRGSRPNLALSILATAVVAVGFQPVRERLQKVANRLVYGRRATPYEVLSEFSGRVAETYAGEEVLTRMAQVLAEGTGAESAEVWLRSGAMLWPAAMHPSGTDGRAPFAVAGQLLPEIPDADRVVPVRHRGELLGALTVSKRRGESLTPIEKRLLDDLGHQAGLVLRNVGLTADLQARLTDLRQSRQRLVAAQDQERRSLERNLHDGAQQNLVAMKVKLGLAEMVSAKDPAKARELLTQLQGDTDEALETLRDLARGIYPALLADQGLEAALGAHGRKAALPVMVQADGVGRYPQEVEAAVYFCVLEALQNVQKYAGATRATVRLTERAGVLDVEIVDDGRGFDLASVKRGAGLTNMADRLDALGGTIEFRSVTGAGTTVAVELPLPQA